MSLTKPTLASRVLIRRHVTALLILVVLWGAANWRLLTPVTVDQWSINAGDFSDQMFTFSSYQAERLSAGQIPTWWPRNNGGQPFVADPQMAAFYPVRLAFIGLSGGHWTYANLQAEAVFSLLLAGLFSYAAVYAITQSFLGAFIAGLILMQSGLLTGYPIQQLPILETFIWLPVAIFMIHQAGTYRAARVQRSGKSMVVVKRRWEWLILAGAAIGIGYLAGHVQTVLMIAYLALAYWGYLVYRNKWSVFAGIFGAVLIGGFAVGLSAVQLFPGLEFMAQSTRNDALDFAAKAGGLTFGSLLQTIWPGIVSYFSPLYIGIASWAAITVGVMVRDPLTRFWSSAAAVAGVLSFGGGTIAFTLVYWLLPGISLFRDQERFALIAVFALSILVAFGIKAIVRGTITVEVLRILRIAAIIVAVPLGLIALGLSLWTFGGGAGNPIGHLDTAVYAFLISLVGLAIIFQMRSVPAPALPGLSSNNPSPFAQRTTSDKPGHPTPPASDRSGGLFGSRPTPPPGSRPSSSFDSLPTIPPDDRTSPFGSFPSTPSGNRPNPFQRPFVPPDDRDLPPASKSNPANPFNRGAQIPPDDRELPPDDRPNPFGRRPSPIPPDDRDLPPYRLPQFGKPDAGSSKPASGSRPPESTSPFGASRPNLPPTNRPPSPAGPDSGSALPGSTRSSSAFGSSRASVPIPAPRPPIRVGAGVALVVLIAFDLLTWSNNNTPSYSAVPVVQQLPRPTYIDPIVADHADLGAWRVDGARVLTPRASQYGLSDVFGASPLQLSSTEALTKLPVDRYWDLFAVRYVISGSAKLPTASQVVTQSSDAHGTFYVHALQSPRPYAWLVYDTDVNPSSSFARQILADPHFPLRDKAMLAVEPTIALGGTRPADATAQITDFAPESITVAVKTSANALLTLALPYYPGWQATIDGKSTPILQNYTALSAVAVPAGEHVISMQFVSHPVIIGGIVSLITLLSLISMGVRWRQTVS